MTAVALPLARAGRAAPAIAPAALYRPFGALRLLLALFVLFQHQLHLLPATDRMFFYRSEIGVVAVAAFFAISGFIVCEANATFYRFRPVAFLENRALRLLPCYFAAVLLAAAAHYALYRAGRFVPLDGPLAGSPLRPSILLSAALEILPGLEPRYISGADFSLIPFAWTLRIESAFYLVAFAVCAFWRPLSPSLAVALGYAAFAFGLWHGGEPQILVYVPLFLFGIAAFDYVRRPDRGRAAHLAVAAFCIAVAFPRWHQRGTPQLFAQMALLAALLAIFLVLALRTRLSPALRRLDRACGDLSYPLYVSHGTILILLADAGPPPGLPLYGTGLTLSLLLAYALHRTIEMPIRHFRDRLRGKAL